MKWIVKIAHLTKYIVIKHKKKIKNKASEKMLTDKNNKKNKNMKT